MSNTVSYSVLRYSPSIVSGESINLGVLFATDDYSEFFYTKRYSRIREFDDTLDIDTIKVFLEAIAEDVKGDLLSSQKKFDIASFVRFYCKEYYFSQVISVPYDNLGKKVEEIKRIYLQFDYDKSKRPTNKEALDFLKTIIAGHGKKFLSNKTVAGKYQDTIKYDIVFGNYGIKYFNFSSNKDLKKIVNDVKAWAWNCENHSYMQPVIIYSSDIHQNDKMRYEILQSVLNILKASTSNVYAIDNTAEQLSLLLK